MCTFSVYVYIQFVGVDMCVHTVCVYMYHQVLEFSSSSSDRSTPITQKSKFCVLCIRFFLCVCVSV